MRIKAIHFKVITAALMALACMMPLSLLADPVQNRSMTPAARHAQRADDVFLSPMGLIPPERKEPGFIFHRASKKDAVQLLKEAGEVERTGDWKKAIGRYDQIVRSYPYAIEAAEAQLRIGRLQEKRGKYKKAFEEYRYLLYYYPENAPADLVLKQMFAIANFYEKRGDSSEAMDYYEKITDIAPKWKYTPMAFLHLGMMQLEKKKYLDAASTFDAIMTGYPGTPIASKAAVSHAIVLNTLANKYPEDDATQLKAISSARTALVLGEKGSEEHVKIAASLEKLVARRYDRHYQMAVFYDCSRYPRETKIAAYKDFLRRFPQAPQARKARARLAQLEQANAGKHSSR